MTIIEDMLPAIDQLSGAVDWLYLLKVAVLMSLAVCLLGTILRLIFGRRSSVTRAVSASISIALVYLLSILIYVLLPELRSILPALPFISVSGEAFYLWDIAELSGSVLYGGLLRLFILAFLVNLLESLLPHGKKLISWYFLRCLTVLAALCAYGAICWLVDAFVPQVFTAWSQAIVIILWAAIALIGLTRLLLTLILTVVNPIIAGLYAFFFSNIIGKQLTKSILTTAVIVLLIAALQQFGLNGFVFSDFSLLSCGPVCIIAFVCLFLFGKFL